MMLMVVVMSSVVRLVKHYSLYVIFIEYMYVCLNSTQASRISGLDG